MSSSPSRAPLPPAALPSPNASRAVQRDIANFPYTDIAAGTEKTLLGKQELEGPALLQAKETGRQQGERDAQAKFAGLLAGERLAVSQAVTDFAREREIYFRRIEAEAVQLALSIARKVLHREAQVDPLLLMGTARVAMEKIAGATQVTLAVNPLQAAGWRSYLVSHLDPAMMPEIVEDAAMSPERCELRTSMGTASLGVEVQLKEIEQGLADLLAVRPQAKS